MNTDIKSASWLHDMDTFWLTLMDKPLVQKKKITIPHWAKATNHWPPKHPRASSHYGQGERKVDTKWHTLCVCEWMLNSMSTEQPQTMVYHLQTPERGSWEVCVCICVSMCVSMCVHACTCVCVWTQLKCPLGGEYQWITLMTVDRLFCLPELILSLMMLSFTVAASPATETSLPITNAWQVCFNWGGGGGMVQREARSVSPPHAVSSQGGTQ